ncbi:MAG: peptidoglycan bridge formation glycyltransferase FemA/FemB family protein [Candidatus Moranbacteria bacterium]|nr:peptidoglycan bridge formation glycyltransferase FemA/FemB family protein [Candidatus Moranbacteria bacterium]
MENKLSNFIESNSPDGGFLQSEDWKNFQEAWGRNTYTILVNNDDGELAMYANIIEHELPIVGKYFYVPRGPVVCNTKHVTCNSKIKKFIDDLIGLAEEENIGWIRIEPNNEKDLSLIREKIPNALKIKKSTVDMQPREVLVLDISKREEEILVGMKQKTRYNIKLAEKKGVTATCNTQHVTQENIDKFLQLVKITTDRDGITSHPEGYYRKMLETIPLDILKLYVAEYEGKIIAANLVLFFGKTATYMHGASDSEHRSVMAPYLLQWRQILDAKKAGCERYDFGGIKTCSTKHVTYNKNSWSGITRFKQGFTPDTETTKFPGSYDIVLNPFKYNLYRFFQRIKRTI